MNKRKLAQRPASPAPPINARKVPAAQSAGNEPQEELMIEKPLKSQSKRLTSRARLR